MNNLLYHVFLYNPRFDRWDFIGSHPSFREVETILKAATQLGVVCEYTTW